MNHIGWTLKGVSDDERGPIMDAIRAAACEDFYLCASVGCKCATGLGKKLCRETSTAGHFPIHVSDGPNWAMTVISLGDAVQVDLYFELPVFGPESSAFHKRLTGFGKALFVQTGSRV